MQAKNDSVRYGTVAMAFHWTIAALIFVNVGLGLYFVNVLAHDDPLRDEIAWLHVSIGISVLVLSAARLMWRLMNPAPPLPAEYDAGKRRLALATHYALYGLMIFVPLAGWALVSLTDRPLVLFGFLPWPKIGFLAAMPAAAKKGIAVVFGASHVISAFLLFLLAIGHFCAALFYHFMIRKDQVLQRMVPGTDVAPS